MISVGIVGATGYTGQELLRLLPGHPEVEVTVVTSRSEEGQAVADFFPSLRGHIDTTFSAPDTSLLSKCDVVFFATPNGIAMQHVPQLLETGTKVIDLSADFRLKDPAQWEQWYGQAHACPKLLDKAVYGLTEINREKISSATLVANPGCYPTAIQLGFIPLLEKNIVDPNSLIADAKSGVSGAGRTNKPHTQFCETADSFAAYAVDGHRHLPEIKQGLEQVHAKPVGLVFVPHLLPMNRGIQATLYATLLKQDTNLQKLYEDRYADEYFIDVMPAGSHPNTASVRGSNQCRIAVTQQKPGHTVIVQVVEDNLVKGAAGQAIQNMNLMMCLPETTGLVQIPLQP